MHLEYLKVFYEVASVKSISKIANSSHISQPALSQQIQRLEDCLGFKLLERSNKGVELTEAGQIVENYARNLIRTYNNMLEDLNCMKANNSTFRIDACPVVATYALPCVIYKVREQFSHYSFNLTTNFSDVVEQNVINDICHIGFVRGKPKDKTLSCSKVGMDRLVPVASSNMKTSRALTMKSFLEYPLILLNEKFMERKLMEQYMRRLDFDLSDYNIVFNLDSTESVKSAVIKGYGVSFLPYISVKKELYTGQLKEKSIQDFNLDYDIYMIYKKDRNSCTNTMELIKYLKKVGDKSFC